MTGHAVFAVEVAVSLKRPKPFLPFVLLAVLAAVVVPIARADSADAWMRIAEDEAGRPAALEIAVARFVDDQGRRVDLVGVVHVGEPEYYRALDRRLAGYEVVLYELVGDPEALQARASANAPPSLLGLMQGGMQQSLGLQYQLDGIDYERANMVHADFDHDEFGQSMRERGESFLSMFLRAWAVGMAGQSQADAVEANADLIKVLLAENRQLAFKRMLAGQLATQTDLLDMFSGPEGSTLIEARNQRALAELKRQFDRGAREAAIFYGAGHMPDFAQRLERDFGMRRVGTEWLEAWDLRE